VAAATSAASQGTLTKEQQIAAGQTMFAGTCSACHQPSGQGLAPTFPPLAGSDWIKANGKLKVVEAVLNGLQGEVSVNGTKYNSVMPPWSHMNDDDIANIVTYVLNAWGNDGGVVSTAEVARVRATTVRPPGAGH
jgi:nitrite reductase (NO-forming)